MPGARDEGVRKALESVRRELGATEANSVPELAAHLRGLAEDLEDEYGGKRREFREDLRREKERARQYLEIAGVVIVALDAEQRVTLINRKGCELLGLPEEDILGCNWFDTFIPETDRERTRLGFEKLMTGELQAAEYFDNSILTAAGEIRCIAWQNAVVRDEEGRIVGTLSSGEDVTARRRAESESERFHAVLDNTADYVGMAKPDGRLLYLNRAARELLGLGPDEDITEKTVADCYQSTNCELVIRQALETVRISGSWTGEVTWHGPHGRRVPTVLSAFAHRSELGEMQFCSMIAHDISELKKLETQVLRLNQTLEERVAERTAHLRATQEELRAEKERAQTYLDVATVALIALDTEGRVTLINRRGCALLEDTEENILGCRWLDEFLPARDIEKWKAMFRDTIAGREPMNLGEATIVTRSGQERLIAWASTVLQDENGSIIGTLGSGQDITDQRRAQEELRSSVSQLRLITDSVPMLIAQVDSECRYRFNNAGYEHFFGVAREKLEGTHVRELLGEERYANVKPCIDRALAGHTVELEVQIPDKEGRVRDMTVQYVPDRTESGDVVGFYTVVADVTERKQLEKALRQSQKMEAVGLLASGISHDFNNLLMGIGGCANVALSRAGADSPAKIYLDEIRSAAASGASISRQLLDLSHPRNGADGNIALDAIIASSESMLRRLLGADVELRIDLRAGTARIRMAKGQLEQILMNLVVNARDASPEGGTIDIETSTIELDPERARLYGGLEPGRFLTLVVRDSGSGMDAATVERIFEPFFTTKKAGEGTGLGLSTAYSIVSRQGGYVDVQSKLGEGTTFTIFLPESEGVARQLPSDTQPEHPGTETVLVVEDDRLVQLTIREYLAGSGYKVLVASDGDEAVQVARAHQEPIPLLISDMVLPGLTGSKVAQAILKIHPETQVIYMSAHSAPMLAEAGHLQEGTPTLQKPFDEEELLARVHAVLGHRPAPSMDAR